MKILSIETSCDDSGIAITENLRVIASAKWTNVEKHNEFRGVVPHEAKRQHNEFLPKILEYLKQQIDFPLSEIDYIAVTYGPGLAIALEAGIQFAKKLSLELDKPVIAINHMVGHIYANLVQDANGNPLSELATLEFPVLVLTISGGHTQLVLMKDHLEFEIIGTTLDDAAGEAYDKVGRMLGMGFPAGPDLEAAAQKGNDIYEFPRPMLKNKQTLDFSFSGLKTAVLYKVKELVGKYNKDPKKKEIKIVSEGESLTEQQINDLAASFQSALIDSIISKVDLATIQYQPKLIVVGGGVIANQTLRIKLEEIAKKYLVKLSYPIPLYLCTDNPDMIAAAAYFYIKQKEHNKNINKYIFTPENLNDLDRDPSVNLDNF